MENDANENDTMIFENDTNGWMNFKENLILYIQLPFWVMKKPT